LSPIAAEIIMVWDALLFDFDGVLADTEPIHWRCWAGILQEHGFNLEWSTYREWCRGVAPRRMRAALRDFTPAVDSISDLELQYQARKEAAFANLAENSPVPEETVSLLQTLHGYRLGVVTTAARSVVEPVLRELQHPPSLLCDRLWRGRLPP
jgi:beta-phosphoglucomutase